MWTIRREQVETFRQHHLQKFEDEMVGHSKEFSPQLCRTIGEEQLRVALRAGINVAGSYGFTNRGPIRLFVEMRFLFGSSFDTDPQYPWAARILHSSEEQMVRAGRLYEGTLDYQEKVSGPDEAYSRAALEELSIASRHLLELSPNALVSGILDQLARVFPRKATYVGEQCLRMLIIEGSAEARKYGFTMVREHVLLIVLMLVLGHGCTHDPLYPWIAQTMKDEKIDDPSTRAALLEKKAIIRLEHTLAGYSGRTQE